MKLRAPVNLSTENTMFEDKLKILTRMLDYVKVSNNTSYNGYNTRINKILTDKYTPSEIYEIIFNIVKHINLKEFVFNKNNTIKDINVIRLTSILLDIINNTKDINDHTTEFRELALTSSFYSYNYNYNDDPFIVPNMYIEELKDKLTRLDTVYQLHTNLDKIITSIGYINICLFIDINRYYLQP